MESEIKLPKKGIVVGVELENLNEFLTELSIR
jgi:hypothetical protein